MDSSLVEALLARCAEVARSSIEAIYLGEGNPQVIHPIDRAGNILTVISPADRELVLGRSVLRHLPKGMNVLTQGERYDDIYIIQAGGARTYYVSPSGREYTLAYWTPGHFIGVPELFGTGENLWSVVTTMPTNVAVLSSEDLRWLLPRVPAFAISLIEGLCYKGRVLSAALQMLGTRSMTSRLAQMLLTLAARHGRRYGCIVRIEQSITHEDLAKMIGSTRQWVTATLTQFKARGLLARNRGYFDLLDTESLRKLVR